MSYAPLKHGYGLASIWNDIHSGAQDSRILAAEGTSAVEAALRLPRAEELLQEGRVVDCPRQERHHLLLPHLRRLHPAGHPAHLLIMRLHVATRTVPLGCTAVIALP